MDYPVQIPVKHWEGSKAKFQREYPRLVEIADQIETYLNDNMKIEALGKTKMFGYWEIARDLGLTDEEVRSVLFPYDNGLMITKRN